MKHSKETIKHVYKKLSDAMTDYSGKPFDGLRVHISAGNKKIGHAWNFSMAPLHTCPNCSGCSEYCYDVKACMQYPNVIKARAENTILMREHREETFREIDKFISKKRTHRAFRWHVSGDIPDMDYFARVVRVARKHPDWRFWLYTKNYLDVNNYMDLHGGPGSFWKDSIPDNLVPMFSVWNGMACPNPHRCPTFTCIQEGMTPNPLEWRCPGNCQTCLDSGHGCPFGESSNVNEH